MKFAVRCTVLRTLLPAVTFAVISSTIAMTWTPGGSAYAAKEIGMGFLRKNDGDGDKKLSLDEFVTAFVTKATARKREKLAQSAEERFNKADKNGDGMTDGKKPMNLEQFSEVTAERITARVAERVAEKSKQRFIALDTNGDSFIDKKEIKARKKAADQ